MDILEESLFPKITWQETSINTEDFAEKGTCDNDTAYLHVRESWADGRLFVWVEATKKVDIFRATGIITVRSCAFEPIRETLVRECDFMLENIERSYRDAYTLSVFLQTERQRKTD